MDTHHLVIDPGLRPRTSTLPDERSDDGGGDLLPETEGVAATLPQPGPDTLATGRERRRTRLMAGVAAFQTTRPYEIVRRQGDYARRLDALAAQRGQE